MSGQTMRERILGLVQGYSLDRVPFVLYEGMLPLNEVREHIGRERIGVLRWSGIHRVEHPHCRFESETYWRVGGNVPHHAWRTSFAAIADAIEAFGVP
jgi:hypothetical protein